MLNDADFQVDIDRENSTTGEVVEGDTVDVVADIENVGDVSGEQVINLQINGTFSQDGPNVELNASESQKVEFSYETEQADIGELNFTVASRDDADTLNVSVLRDAEFDVAVDRSNSTTGEVVEGDGIEI
ncbi:hypothetical protein, partial [Halorubrum sp. Atlit-26R]|uniref:hypothetical protein n=1 Tax=Halorubrum sp. Atlit-26R TaxID=2282128 RepID=UPI0018F57DA6